MSIQRSALSVLLLALTILGNTGAAQAQAASASPSTSTETYQLQPVASSYVFGCYPPCLCPIAYAGDLQGTLTLDFVSFDGTHNVYDVTLVNWEVVNLAGTISQVITGTGTYRRPPVVPGDEELTLDVILDGQPHVLTSGLVATTTPLTDISIAVAENGFYCFDNVLTISATQVTVSPATQFVRGDCNENGSLDLSDAVAGLGILFAGAAPPDCIDSCDCNADGAHNLGDPVFALSYMFSAGAVMPPPFPTCGTSPTPMMGCSTFAACP